MLIVCSIERNAIRTVGNPEFGLPHRNKPAFVIFVSRFACALLNIKMARRGDAGNLFVGRVSKNARAKDLEDVFGTYGRMLRCDIKYGNTNNMVF